MRSGKIMIIYFVKLNKVAVISKKYFEDPENGKPTGSVRLKKEKEYSKETKKYWDTVTVWKEIMMDYDMMVCGNSEISKAVEKLVRYK